MQVLHYKWHFSCKKQKIMHSSCKKITARYTSCKIWLNLAKNYLAVFLARSVQDFLLLTRIASFLVQDLQDLMHDLVSLAREIIARLVYFLQDGFYWVATVSNDFMWSSKIEDKSVFFKV